MGGIASVITPSITPYFIMPYSAGATRYVLYAGLQKAYVHDGSSETEITKSTHPAVKTVSSASSSGTTVTITTGSSHGLATNDIVTLVNFKAGSNSAHFNVMNAVITVTGGSTFTYQGIGSFSGSASSPMGTYSIVFSANDVASNFTATADTKWSGDNLNGVVFVNSPNDGLYYWDQLLSAKLHTFPDASVTTQAAARCFKNYIFLIGPTTAGTTYRHRVQWSQSADPGSIPTSFTTSATNDAGFQDLVSEGEAVDAKEWGDTFFIYKRDRRFSARLIGGQYVFDFQTVSGNHKDDGLLSVGCIANTPKGQVFLTDGHDVRIHVGGESQSIAIGRVRDYLRSNIDSTYRKRAFLLVNPPFNEVWVCYPETGSATISKALVWNWEDDTWGIRGLTNITAGGSGEYPTSIEVDACLLVGKTTPAVGLVDSGYTDFGTTLTSTLERTGMDLDDPGFKLLDKSMPLFNAETNFTATIYHGSANTQDATPSYSSGTTYTHNTTSWVHAYAPSGRFVAWKMSMSPNDTPTISQIDFNFKTMGAY
jgi:hypothetical protein